MLAYLHQFDAALRYAARRRSALTFHSTAPSPRLQAVAEQHHQGQPTADRDLFDAVTETFPHFTEWLTRHDKLPTVNPVWPSAGFLLPYNAVSGLTRHDSPSRTSFSSLEEAFSKMHAGKATLHLDGSVAYLSVPHGTARFGWVVEPSGGSRFTLEGLKDDKLAENSTERRLRHFMGLPKAEPS